MLGTGLRGWVCGNRENGEGGSEGSGWSLDTARLFEDTASVERWGKEAGSWGKDAAARFRHAAGGYVGGGAVIGGLGGGGGGGGDRKKEGEGEEGGDAGGDVGDVGDAGDAGVDTNGVTETQADTNEEVLQINANNARAVNRADEESLGAGGDDVQMEVNLKLMDDAQDEGEHTEYEIDSDDDGDDDDDDLVAGDGIGKLDWAESEHSVEQDVEERHVQTKVDEDEYGVKGEVDILLGEDGRRESRGMFGAMEMGGW